MKAIDRLVARVAAPMDGSLLSIVGGLLLLGLLTLYSASSDNPVRITSQLFNVGTALAVMWVAAQVPPQTLMRFAVPAYLVGLLLLVAVALYGDIRNAMFGVNKEGTGARAFAGAGYTSAGKTGTAQVVALKQNEKYHESRVQERHRDHALFIVFAPVESPKIALAVLVENAGFGARAAAPIARRVLDYYLLGKRAPPVEKAPAEAIEDGEDESD